MATSFTKYPTQGLNRTPRDQLAHGGVDHGFQNNWEFPKQWGSLKGLKTGYIGFTGFCRGVCSTGVSGVGCKGFPEDWTDFLEVLS